MGGKLMVNQVKTSGYQQVSQHKKIYDKFGGVDFSAGDIQVAESRSPDALNMISDQAGFPVKRPGWRKLVSFGNAINGIHIFAENNFLIHSGSSLYRWKDGIIRLLGGFQCYDYSSSFHYDGKLYVLTGYRYLMYDGENVSDVYLNAYTPTTTVGIGPNGGGRKFQEANLIGMQRINTLAGDGQSRSFPLDCQDISLIAVEINGEVLSPSAYQLSNGKVVFNQAPPAVTDGQEANVVVTIYHPMLRSPEVLQCAKAAVYANRVFFSGNPDCKNVDYASEVNDPSYFPESLKTEVGYDDSAIMGYLRMGDSLAIIKEDNRQDATVFLRTAQISSKGEAFSLKQGVAGIGAISRDCFANLVDDPLFLTPNGVYAVGSQSVSAEKSLQNRSSRVNARLTREPGLENAVAAQWDGYYILCLNNHAYVADSRQQSSANNPTHSYEYEWYYWDNIPAKVLCSHNSALYFGTADGHICRFNNDLVDEAGDYLNQAYNDDGAAITAYWSTPKSADGSFMTYKTMPKRGCGLYLRDYPQTSVKISLITERDFGRVIRSVETDEFDFSKLDFENFSFATVPQSIIAFNTRVKKYRTIQVLVMNDQLNQGFGLCAIERKYLYGSQAKGG